MAALSANCYTNLLLMSMRLLALGFISLSVALPIEDPSSNSSVRAIAAITIQHRSHSQLSIDSQGRALQEAKIESGFYLAESDYFARLTLGGGRQRRWRREFYFTIDTGSDVTWIQCQPCLKCYPQLDEPVFNPRHSTTLTDVSGSSPLCTRLADARTSTPTSPKCTYTIRYKDSATTSGKLVTDTIEMGPLHTFSEIAFGCSNRNKGHFNPSAGMLALGRDYFSLPFQLRRKSGFSTFSYCFPAMYSDDTSTLTFGAPIPPNTVFTPLITNPVRRFQHLYYIQMTGISVGGDSLSLPQGLFDIDVGTGNGGTLIDSGATITALHQRAYKILRDTVTNAINAYAKQLFLAHPYEEADLETCYLPYDGVRRLYDGVPHVTFHFQDGAALEVSPETVLVPINKESAVDRRLCLSFVSADRPQTVLGNVHRQRVRFTFDLENDGIGFTPNAC